MKKKTVRKAFKVGIAIACSGVAASLFHPPILQADVTGSNGPNGTSMGSPDGGSGESVTGTGIVTGGQGGDAYEGEGSGGSGGSATSTGTDSDTGHSATAYGGAGG
jgi:hypothetical protein